MNNNEFCFIMCVNNEFQANECQLYINQLNIPEDYSIDIITVSNASSMASGYNAAMKSSSAKYKIYLHQDVILVNKNILSDLLSIFHSDSSIGLIGVVGNRRLGDDGCPWSDNSIRVGKLMQDLIFEKAYRILGDVVNNHEEVIAIDGLFMATAYDIPWREDLFSGWDMYDLSQSIEFRRAGYNVIVPDTEHPWCLHDNDLLKLTDYNKWLQIFTNEYSEDINEWNKDHPVI